jgi:hypothetical protein
MLGKHAKLASFLFVGVFLLPLMGLLIMDYQVKKANDITGSYLYGAGNYDHALAGVVLFGIVVIVLALATITRLRKAREHKPEVKIDERIKRIDEELKRI